MTARPSIPAIAAAPLAARIEKQWDSDIVPQLVEYVRIPAKSPHFDHDWAKNGHIEAAIRQAEKWVLAQRVPGLKLEIVRLGDRTPVLFFDIPATGGTGLCLSIVRQPAAANGWQVELRNRDGGGLEAWLTLSA